MRTAKTALLPYYGGSGGPRLVNADPRGTARLASSYISPANKVMGSLNTLGRNYPGYPATFSHVWVRTLPNGAKVSTDMYYVYVPVNATLNG